MKLASHNSWSYLPVRKWWMRPLNLIAKCQEKPIVQQYYDKARCFDLRLRWDEKEEDFVLAHGIVTYMGKYYRDLLWLDEQAYKNNEEIYIRVLLEDSGKANRVIDDSFYRKCKHLEKRFSFIKFIGGFPVRKRWREYIYTFKTKEPSIEEQHVSVSGKWWQIIPYRWAKKNNKRMLEQGTNYKFLMLDFI